MRSINVRILSTPGKYQKVKRINARMPQSISNLCQSLSQATLDLDVSVNADLANLIMLVVVKANPEVAVGSRKNQCGEGIPLKEQLVRDPVLSEEPTEGAAVDEVLLGGQVLLVVFSHVPKSAKISSVGALVSEAFLDGSINILLALVGLSDVHCEVGWDADGEGSGLSDNGKATRAAEHGLSNYKKMSQLAQRHPTRCEGMGMLTVDWLQRTMEGGIVTLDIVLEKSLGHLERGVVTWSGHLDGWMVRSIRCTIVRLWSCGSAA